MPYNTKAIKVDVNAKPVPQYFNPALDDYEALYGANGAMRTLLYDANGNPLLTEPNPGYVRAGDGMIAALGALADAAQTNPAVAASVIALLKGLLTKLADPATAARQDAIKAVLDALNAKDYSTETTLANLLNALVAIRDTNGIKKIADAIDISDRATRALGVISAADGGIASIGAKADAAVTDPTLSASEIALLKGLLKQLQGGGTGSLPVLLNGSKVPQSYRVLSTIPLAANAWYNQPDQVAKDVIVDHVMGVAYTGAIIYADTPGVLYLYEKHGSSWLITGQWPVGGGERQIIPLQPITTGIYHWSYKNGSVAQTSFYLAEFVSQIDGRVRPTKLQIWANKTVPAAGSAFVGQTQLLGYRTISLYVRSNRNYDLTAYPGIGQSVTAGTVKFVSDAPATGTGTAYHQVPSTVLPTYNLDILFANKDTVNDATVDMWLVAIP